MISIVGIAFLVGYFVITASWVPQWIRFFRIKKSDQFSLPFMWTLQIALSMLVPYAVLEGTLEVKIGVLANFFTQVFSLAVIYYYRKHPGGRS